MSCAWIAACAADAHVRIGRAGGFMQVNHGKGPPLRRISPGDRVIYYSPTETYPGKDKVQAFTALGIVRPGDPYQAEMSACFHPWRRDVDWFDIKETPIRPLLGSLAFTRDTPNWGYQLRFGLFGIENEDADRIFAAMTLASEGVETA